MKPKELKATIRCVHRLWYADWQEDPQVALDLHRHLSVLFNYAGIEETLAENNPNEVSTEEFARMHGLK